LLVRASIELPPCSGQSS
ncbi:hypothetical protein A2U01_0114699, partial [Trifolium medium]|nr:hypothetical protein [Trifolium medium]